MQKVILFDPALNTLVKSLADHFDPSNDSEMLFNYIFKVISHSRNQSDLEEYGSLLLKDSTSYEKVHQAVRYIFLSDPSIAETFLLGCHVSSIRDFARRFFGTLLKRLGSLEETIYIALSSMLSNSPYHWRIFGEFFHLLRDLVEADQQLAFELLKRGFLWRTIDIFAEKTSPFAATVVREHRFLRDALHRADFTDMVKFVIALVRVYPFVQEELPENLKGLDSMAFEGRMIGLLQRKVRQLVPILYEDFSEALSKFSDSTGTASHAGLAYQLIQAFSRVTSKEEYEEALEKLREIITLDGVIASFLIALADSQFLVCSISFLFKSKSFSAKKSTK